MNLKELESKINAKVNEVKDLVAKDDIEGAKTAKEELKALQDKYELLVDLQGEQTEGVQNGTVATKVVDKPEDSTKVFADAARQGFQIKNAVATNNEGTGANGGYVVPQDIQTKINEYRDAQFSLLQLIDVEKVSTNTGRRTFQKKSQQTGFSKVLEGGKVTGKAGPTFETLSYTIEKFGGYFPVTNELLADSDQNITQTLIKWIGGESRATANAQILAAVKTNTATELKDIDGIQKAILVTLGAAYSNTSKIVTNDDGVLYLSTLKDNNGNYLLRALNNDPMKQVLAVGTMAIPVVQVPNGVLASDGSVSGKSGIPFIVGDLKEGIKKFDRNMTSVVSSNTASVTDFNAFEQDMTLFRALEREDYVVKDKAAFVNGKITIATA